LCCRWCAVAHAAGVAVVVVGCVVVVDVVVLSLSVFGCFCVAGVAGCY